MRPNKRGHIAVGARNLLRRFHVVANAGEALEIFPDVGARLVAGDAQLVGEAESRNAVDDAEIDRLRAAPDFARHAFDRHAEHFRGGHRVNVEVVREGALERWDVGEMGEEPELDLAIVGRDELAPFGRDEGAPDLAPFLGADRNVLQVGFRGRQAPGRGRSERIGRVDAMRRRVDEAWQRVGIGRLELGDLSPFEHARRQLMAFGGEVLEHARGGRPGAGRGLLAPGQAHLAEQNIAKLFRRAGVEGCAHDPVDLVFEPGHALGKLACHAREDVSVDRDPAPLHARQNLDERTLEPLVDHGHLLSDDARLQNAPEAERDVRFLRSVFAGFFDRRPRQADEIATRARDFAQGNGFVAEKAIGERNDAVIVSGRAGVERVREQHRVVDRRDANAAQCKDMEVELDVVADLEDARLLEQRLQKRDRFRFRHLPRREARAVEEIVGAGLVSDRGCSRPPPA